MSTDVFSDIPFLFTSRVLTSTQRVVAPSAASRSPSPYYPLGFLLPGSAPCLLVPLRPRSPSLYKFCCQYQVSLCSRQTVTTGNATTYWPVLGFTPPSGISLLSPAPDASEPYFTSAPGNLFSTEVSTPDSYFKSTLRFRQKLQYWYRVHTLVLSLAPLFPSPVLAALELRSRSACWAMASGS